MRIGTWNIAPPGATLGENLRTAALATAEGLVMCERARVMDAFVQSIRHHVRPEWPHYVTFGIAALEASPQPDSYVAGAATEYSVKFSKLPLVVTQTAHDWNAGTWYIGRVDSHLPHGVVAWLGGTRQLSRSMIEANGSSMARAMRAIDSALASKGVLWIQST